MALNGPWLERFYKHIGGRGALPKSYGFASVTFHRKTCIDKLLLTIGGCVLRATQGQRQHIISPPQHLMEAARYNKTTGNIIKQLVDCAMRAAT